MSALSTLWPVTKFNQPARLPRGGRLLRDPELGDLGFHQFTSEGLGQGRAALLPPVQKEV